MSRDSFTSVPPPVERKPWQALGAPMLECRGVVRELGGAGVKTRVLDQIDLVVREREFVSLTGLTTTNSGTCALMMASARL